MVTPPALMFFRILTDGGFEWITLSRNVPMHPPLASTWVTVAQPHVMATAETDTENPSTGVTDTKTGTATIAMIVDTTGTVTGTGILMVVTGIGVDLVLQ